MKLFLICIGSANQFLQVFLQLYGQRPAQLHIVSTFNVNLVNVSVCLKTCQKSFIHYASCIRDHSPSSFASDFTCPQMLVWFVH